MDGDRVRAQTEPFPEITGRVRDIRQFSDGSIHVVTDDGVHYRVRATR